MDWFYAQNNRQVGPVAFDALHVLLQRRQVQPQDLVWREGMPDWAPAAAVPELATAFSPPGQTVGYFNPLASSPLNIVFAGFWMRFAAFVIDYLILSVLGQVVAGMMAIQMPMLMRHSRSPFAMLFAVGSEVFLVQVSIGWLYYSIMETSRYQATLGKLALGILVTDLDGNRINFGRASARYFAKLLSYLSLYIGFIMAGFTEKKQALHDIVASCLVIRKRPKF